MISPLDGDPPPDLHPLGGRSDGRSPGRAALRLREVRSPTVLDRRVTQTA